MNISTGRRIAKASMLQWFFQFSRPSVIGGLGAAQACLVARVVTQGCCNSSRRQQVPSLFHIRIEPVSIARLETITISSGVLASGVNPRL